jgi:hypothetical protein
MTSRKNSTDEGRTEVIELNTLNRRGLDKNGEVIAIEFVDSESGSSSEDIKRNLKNPLATARDLVTEILSVEDDPTLVRDCGARGMKLHSHPQSESMDIQNVVYWDRDLNVCIVSTPVSTQASEGETLSGPIHDADSS